MTLIKSISGIRGTIGGYPGEGLTPLDIVRFSSAYGEWIRKRVSGRRPKLVLGRDARITGEMLEKIVSGTLIGLGIDVISLGLASTPTVEIAVIKENADGGIILTASHNPGQWNALKLLNVKGEFISADDGKEVVALSQSYSFNYVPADQIGKIIFNNNYNDIHIEEILRLDLVNPEIIRQSEFRIAVDCINSVGGLIVPKLLKALGVKEIYELNCNPDGLFKHNPEPIPENLGELADIVKKYNADAGFAVDPDVDRLAVVSENGEMFGEEYTLVAVADYVLGKTSGNTASNLSSSRALKDITLQHGQKYFNSEVGEVNVVNVMKANNCVIGGEGNGGVIYPASHYGRDALVGIALFLTLLAEKKIKCSELKAAYPFYEISKNKIILSEEMDTDRILEKVIDEFKTQQIDLRDGVKIDFPDSWVHLRKSNTEPIIRIYAEARDINSANLLIEKITKIIRS